MSTPEQVIALLEKLQQEVSQDAQDAAIENKGAAATARRQNRVAAINQLKAQIKAAAAQL